MQNDYEQRTQALISDLAQIQKTWGDSGHNGYADAKKQLFDFETYKATTKRSWVTEKRELDTVRMTLMHSYWAISKPN
jgi:hypothetical protein